MIVFHLPRLLSRSLALPRPTLLSTSRPGQSVPEEIQRRSSRIETEANWTEVLAGESAGWRRRRCWMLRKNNKSNLISFGWSNKFKIWIKSNYNVLIFISTSQREHSSACHPVGFDRIWAWLPSIRAGGAAPTSAIARLLHVHLSITECSWCVCVFERSTERNDILLSTKLSLERGSRMKCDSRIWFWLFWPPIVSGFWGDMVSQAKLNGRA